MLAKLGKLRKQILFNLNLFLHGIIDFSCIHDVFWMFSVYSTLSDNAINHDKNKMYALKFLKS